MTSSPATRPFEVRHVQLARAAFGCIAAVMITFSSDHSAAVGLSVFGGFGIATGLTLILAAWLVQPSGRRWPAVLTGALSIAAGVIAGISGWHSATFFFAVVIAWAVSTGAVEATVGWRGLRRRADPGAPPASQSRDALTVGVVTLALAVALAFVPVQFAVDYTIESSQQSYTLTGITIAVGIFGAYAAIVAVYLAIAGLSPRPPVVAPELASPTDERGVV